MNLSNELATCVAKIKSWDVSPDQEPSRVEVLRVLEQLTSGFEIRRGAYQVLSSCDHRECLCGAPMPLTRKGKTIEVLQEILDVCGFDSA
jgi:hypothetical protein